MIVKILKIIYSEVTDVLLLYYTNLYVSKLMINYWRNFIVEHYRGDFYISDFWWFDVV